MEYTIRDVTEADRQAVTDVFNFFVENSYAAYPEQEVGAGFFDHMLALAKGYPFYVIEAPGGKVVGFGLIHKYHGAPTFNRTAELSYFFLPEYTGKGIGTRILDMLTEGARAMGVDTLLASISSRNEQSLNFHKKYGFIECGRFKRVGRKWDRDFDVIWMQKFI